MDTMTKIAGDMCVYFFFASDEPVTPKTKEESLLRSPCLVPEAGLPPLYIITGESGEF